MATKRRRSPANPLAIMEARRQRQRAEMRARMREEGVDPDIAEWGDEAISSDRQAMLLARGVELQLDQRRRVKSARRADIWRDLYTRGRLTRDQYDAVQELRELMAERVGTGGRDETLGDVRVDFQGDACAVTDRMLRAGERVDTIMRLIGPPSCRLLGALLWPSVLGEEYDWRAIVAKETGEMRPEAQTAPLRMAAQALADVRDDVDRIVGHAREARRDGALSARGA